MNIDSLLDALDDTNEELTTESIIESLKYSINDSIIECDRMYAYDILGLESRYSDLIDSIVELWKKIKEFIQKLLTAIFGKSKRMKTEMDKTRKTADAFKQFLTEKAKCVSSKPVINNDSSPEPIITPPPKHKLKYKLSESTLTSLEALIDTFVLNQRNFKLKAITDSFFTTKMDEAVIYGLDMNKMMSDLKKILTANVSNPISIDKYPEYAYRLIEIGLKLNDLKIDEKIAEGKTYVDNIISTLSSDVTNADIVKHNITVYYNSLQRLQSIMSRFIDICIQYQYYCRVDMQLHMDTEKKRGGE